MQASSVIINYIKEFEGIKLKSYKCPSGIYTIGYGHTRNVKPNQTITKTEADKLLREDIHKVELQLNKLNLKLNQGQYDAILSFTFNLGIGYFQKSTLYKMIQANPNDNNIPIQILKYNTAGGNILTGLCLRRRIEAELYTGII